MSKNIKKGFTLIELLIVIAIIGILAVALLPTVLNAPARARDSARKADIAAIVKAVETFNIDKGNYPSEAFCTNTAADLTKAGVLGITDYFSSGKPPVDPSAGQVVPNGCTGGYYYCPLDGSPNNYMIVTKLEGEGNNLETAGVPAVANCNGTATLGGSGTDLYAVAQ